MLLKLTAPFFCMLALISAQPLVDDDVLEPSVQNEVAHALRIAPTNSTHCAVSRADTVELLVGTNSLSATDVALRLISSQRSDGRWLIGTNDVTQVAVEMLEALGVE